MLKNPILFLAMGIANDKKYLKIKPIVDTPT
jgi:hypothetical protein